MIYKITKAQAVSKSLQGSMMQVLLHGGKHTIGELRILLEDEWLDKLDPVASERKFLDALTDLKNDGDIKIKGPLTDDGTVVSRLHH